MVRHPGEEADIAGPFWAALKLASSRRLTTPGSKSGHLAAVLRQIDPRPRIALLQSLVGVNQDHVRTITGMRSTHLSRCPHHMPTLEQRTEQAGHMAALLNVTFHD